MLQVVGAAKGGGDVAKALLFVERMLMEQDMMQPHWAAHFQPAWRKGLAKCNEARHAIMYLAALQVPTLSRMYTIAVGLLMLLAMGRPTLVLLLSKCSSAFV